MVACIVTHPLSNDSMLFCTSSYTSIANKIDLTSPHMIGWPDSGTQICCDGVSWLVNMSFAVGWQWRWTSSGSSRKFGLFRFLPRLCFFSSQSDAFQFESIVRPRKLSYSVSPPSAYDIQSVLFTAPVQLVVRCLEEPFLCAHHREQRNKALIPG